MSIACLDWLVVTFFHFKIYEAALFDLIRIEVGYGNIEGESLDRERHYSVNNMELNYKTLQGLFHRILDCGNLKSLKNSPVNNGADHW